MIRAFKTCTGRRFCTILLLLLSLCTAAAATNLTGTFKNPDGTLVNGKIIFLLSQPARLNDQSAQIVPMVKIFSVDNGALESGAFIYGNDVLVPGGTYYLVRLVDTNNNLLFEQKWSISGVNLNLGTLTPTTSGVVYPDPLIKNLASSQAVQGPVSFSAPITAFSLTLNGNLNPGAPDLYDLGSSSAPWKELHAQRWNSLFAVGGSGGMATPPAAAPNSSVTLSGGSIADGTYYCKFTYVNKNGETTGSPAVTITVSGGGGSATVHVGDAAGNDWGWTTGAYGVRHYCSNDNVTFYRQTPNPVVADFMVDATTHYVRMGAVGSRFTSFTFSGTALPTTNTAVIDPLQVALNATRRAPSGSSRPVPFGTLFVPAIDGTVNPSGQFVLTTPLIVVSGDHIVGSGLQAGTVDMQTRIIGSASWNNTKLGTVMSFGGTANISDVGIQGQSSNALMILGGHGMQVGSGGPSLVSNSYLRSPITSGYAGYLGVGIMYDVYFKNVSILGGYYNVEYRNVGGGEHYFDGGRWDATGEGFVRNVPGWNNPDDGDHAGGCGTGGWCNGLSKVAVRHIRTEQAHGIPWDVVNLNFTLEDVEVADIAVRAGTDSILHMGSDAYGAGATGTTLTIINTSPGSSSNARVGTMVASGGGNQTSITLIGNSDLGSGSSTGQGIGLDANNIQLVMQNLSTGGKFTMNPSASGNQAVTAINVPNDSVIVGGGGGSPLIGQGGQWYEIPDRLVLVPHTGNNIWARNNRMSFKNDANSLIIYGSDDATPRFTFQHGSGGSNAGLLSLTSLRVGVNPAQVGGTSGDIGIRNNGALWGRNAANSADIPLIFLNSSDQIQLGSSSSHALKISGQINSTITTGTAPFVVASTTQVVNLNVSQLVGKTWAIPDPIGATTPAAITGTTVAANTSVTIGGGTAITMVISATASLDFPSTALSTCSDLTMTVTGAAAGDPVFLGAPSASVPGGGSFFAWVSAANTVTVRFCADGTARDPASGAFRAAVVKF